MKINLKASGQVRVVKRKACGDVVFDSGFNDNLVLDNGLDLLPSTSRLLQFVGAVLRFISVGTSSTTPAENQTQLLGHVASGDAGGAATGGADQVVELEEPDYRRFGFIRSYEFAQGEAQGNLSEVGLGEGAGGTNLFARTLIKDENGDPTTLTVLSDEFLTIYWRVWFYYPVEDIVQTLNGHTFTLRPMNLAVTTNTSNSFSVYVNRVCLDANGWRMGINSQTSQGLRLLVAGSPLRSVSAGTTFNNFGTGLTISHNNFGDNYGNFSYVPGSYERRSWISLGPGDGNLDGGIGLIAFVWGPCAWQMAIDPAIPKTADDKFDMEFTFAWGRYTPPE